MKINDDAFLWKRWAQLTFLSYMQPERALVTVMLLDLIIQCSRCLSVKGFHSLTKTVQRLEHLSPICWDCVTHRKTVQLSFDPNTSKNKKTMTPSVQHLTAPFCSTRSMSSMLEPSPVLQTDFWYIFITRQLVIFNFCCIPRFLDLMTGPSARCGLRFYINLEMIHEEIQVRL